MKRQLYGGLERGRQGAFGTVSGFPGLRRRRKIAGRNHRKGGRPAGAGGGCAVRQGSCCRTDPIRRIVLPKGCDFLAYFCQGGPADPSERVNVYLPKSLIGQIDRRAAELGMSRSSFFGLAASTALTYFPVHTVVRPELAEPRSKVHKTGRLRTKTSPAKKSSV
jgi:hypothetical protein